MAKDDKITTMKDIAQQLGVSVATVSRALSDSPRISEERREMIKAYAKAHNFQPNKLAETLRKTRIQPSKTIGVILPEYTHFYFSSVMTGLDEVASSRGYLLMVAQSAEDYEHEVEVCQRLYNNKVCGIIVSQSKSTIRYDHFIDLQKKGMPMVFFDRICTGIEANRVVVDDYQGAFNATEYLIGTGCRRIAYFGSPRNLEISKNRYNGYRDALLKNKIQVDDRLVKLCDNRLDAEVLAREMLEDDFQPDAFFAVNDETAIGVMVTAKDMGYRIPADISVCGFTNSIQSVVCDPKLTTVEQRGVEIGRQAAQILIDQVEGLIPANKIEKRVVKTRLVVRQSTR